MPLDRVSAVQGPACTEPAIALSRRKYGAHLVVCPPGAYNHNILAS